MIDRHAREQLATAVRQFGIGAITNRQFETAVPKSKDPAIRAVEEYVWRFYDDFLVHRMAGDRALSLGLRRDFARAVIFLKSDLEYNWPSPAARYRDMVSRWIFWGTAGFWHPPIKERNQSGDLRVWPFYSAEDYCRSLKRRCYLGVTRKRPLQKAAEA
jgi:hypothetical protein